MALSRVRCSIRNAMIFAANASLIACYHINQRFTFHRQDKGVSLGLGHFFQPILLVYKCA